MSARVPERNKKPGLFYATTDDGVELPVIDVTHVAFASRPDDEALAKLVEQSVAAARRWKEMPAPMRWLVTNLVFKRGALTRGLVGARGSYLDGLSTYLLKLGPRNLGKGYAKRIDFQVAATMPAISAMMRLQDVARLLADGVAPLLRAFPGRALRFLNIAGGPASDSFNALLLLQREHPEVLAGRSIAIRVFDKNTAGASFGARAVQALSALGAPLAGLGIRFEYVPYDWTSPDGLRAALGAEDREAVGACSSEGGLFEYGSDEHVQANLSVLRERTSDDAIMVGSVCRADETVGGLHAVLGPSLVPRSLPSFEEICRRAGWRVTQTTTLPVSHVVALRKT